MLQEWSADRGSLWRTENTREQELFDKHRADGRGTHTRPTSHHTQHQPHTHTHHTTHTHTHPTTHPHTHTQTHTHTHTHTRTHTRTEHSRTAPQPGSHDHSLRKQEGLPPHTNGAFVCVCVCVCVSVCACVCVGDIFSGE